MWSLNKKKSLVHLLGVLNIALITILISVFLITLSGCQRPKDKTGHDKRQSKELHISCPKIPRTAYVNMSLIRNTSVFKEVQDKLDKLELYTLTISLSAGENREPLMRELEKLNTQKMELLRDFDNRINGSISFLVDKYNLDLLLSDSSVAYLYNYRDLSDEFLDAFYNRLNAEVNDKWYWGFARVKADLLNSYDENLVRRALEIVAGRENLIVILNDQELLFGGIDVTQDLLKVLKTLYSKGASKNISETEGSQAVSDLSNLPVKCIAYVKSEPLLRALGYRDRLEKIKRERERLLEQKESISEIYQMKVAKEMDLAFKEFYAKLRDLRASTDKAVRKTLANLDPKELPMEIRSKLEKLKREYQRTAKKSSEDFRKQLESLRELYFKYHQELMETEVKRISAEMKQELYQKEAEVNRWLEAREREVEELYKPLKVNIQLKMMTAKSQEELSKYQKELMKVREKGEALRELYRRQADEMMRKFIKAQNERFSERLKALEKETAEKVDKAYRAAAEKLKRAHERTMREITAEFNKKISSLLQGVNITKLRSIREKLREADERYRELLRELDSKRKAISIKYYKAFKERTLEIDRNLRELDKREAQLRNAFLRELRARLRRLRDQGDKTVSEKWLILIDPLYVNENIEDITEEILAKLREQ